MGFSLGIKKDFSVAPNVSVEKQIPFRRSNCNVSLHRASKFVQNKELCYRGVFFKSYAQFIESVCQNCFFACSLFNAAFSLCNSIRPYPEPCSRVSAQICFHWGNSERKLCSRSIFEKENVCVVCNSILRVNYINRQKARVCSVCGSELYFRGVYCSQIKFNSFRQVSFRECGYKEFFSRKRAELCCPSTALCTESRSVESEENNCTAAPAIGAPASVRTFTVSPFPPLCSITCHDSSSRRIVLVVFSSVESYLKNPSFSTISLVLVPFSMSAEYVPFAAVAW